MVSTGVGFRQSGRRVEAQHDELYRVDNREGKSIGFWILLYTAVVLRQGADFTMDIKNMFVLAASELVYDVWVVFLT